MYFLLTFTINNSTIDNSKKERRNNMSSIDLVVLGIELITDDQIVFFKP